MTQCPHCKGTNISRERRPDGNTKCLDCSFIAKHHIWAGLNDTGRRHKESYERAKAKFDEMVDTPEKMAAWVEKARALLFDCQFCVDSPGIIKEISTLIATW
jgi:hypothetical protein